MRCARIGIVNCCLVSFVVSGFVAPFHHAFRHPDRKTSPFPLAERSTSKEDEVIDARKSKRSSDEDDTPSWLKPLLRRDQTAPASANMRYNEQDEKLFDSFPFSVGKEKRSRIWDSEMSPLVASLSGMINVEALMAAANITTSNITNDIESNENIMSDSIELPSSELDAANRTGLAGVDTSVVDDALSFLDGSLRWEKFMQQIQKKEKDDGSKGLNDLKNGKVELGSNFQANGSVETDKSSDVDKILGEATKRLEFAVNSVSSTFSPSAIQDLVVRASKTLAIREASGNLTLAAKIVFDGASKAPRATAKYTAELIEFANATLAGGMKPLFRNYPSVKTVTKTEWRQVIQKASEYSTLSGAIYENDIESIHSIGHSIVAKGKTSDIGWMITDSIQQKQDYNGNVKADPILVRSFIFRGFDASDEEVDREGLLNTICTACPVPLGNSTILVHEGMLEIAESLYNEIVEYIDLTAPTHKFVFAGHSIGGSLSVLLMAILSQRKSSLFVRERLLRVFTFGSPPIFTTSDKRITSLESCATLEALQLPTDIVHGYSQPWDPIPRLFTQYDPLYPLIDDLGEDGVTPYVSGPTRTLRPITKAILEAWEGWPKYRDNARDKLGQNYLSVGKQFLLLPDPTRYLTDRLVSVNIPVPSINSILQISSQELLPALNEVFLLDTFTISIVPVAIRSFVHHFYPAYLDPFVEFAMKTDPDGENIFNKEEESRMSSKR